MPSSISNSDQRLPADPAWRAWALATALTLAVLGAGEIWARARGRFPTVTDDKDLWAQARGRITDSPRMLALLGASRIQLSFSPATFRTERPGWDVVQLAIDGTHPMAALRDLAADPSFHGIALVSVVPASFARHTWNDQQEWVDWWHSHWTVDRDISRTLRSFVQQHLASKAPGPGIQKTVNRFLEVSERHGVHEAFTRLNEGRLAEAPEYLTTFTDRSRRADYTLADKKAMAWWRLSRERGTLTDAPAGPAYDAWLADVAAVAPAVVAIQNRGGRVVFFHDRLSGAYGELYAQNYDRARFWNRLAALTGAVTLHSDDVPALAAITCPDGSHIDGADTPAFTTALVLELEHLAVLPPRQ